MYQSTHSPRFAQWKLGIQLVLASRFLFFFFRKTLPLTSFDMFDSIGIYLKGKSVSKQASKQASESASERARK